MDLILSNLFSFAALGVMLLSIYLQINYIKYKKKSVQIDSKLESFQTKLGVQISLVSFEYEDHSYQGINFHFKKIKFGDSVRIHMNPFILPKKNSSLVSGAIMKVFKVYPGPFPRVYFLNENPSLFHLVLILSSLFLLSLA